MNIYMLKKEIKYLLKNTIFYLGIIIVICTLQILLERYAHSEIGGTFILI